MPNKHKTLAQILAIRRALARLGKKIAVYNGSFDLLHAGHVAALREAKRAGDALIVLLNSDVSVRMYKGPGRPIYPERERAALLSAIEYVDYIVLFDDITPKRLIAAIKPDVYCTGSDWGKNCIERETVEQYGGKIKVLHWREGYSSSETIKKIISLNSTKDAKAVFLDRDGTINRKTDGYTFRKEDFHFLPGVPEALHALSRTQYKIIVVTNQACIGKGLCKKSDVEILHRWMVGALKKKSARIDKIYFCPHSEKDLCECRKPKIGMFLRAVRDFRISLNKSWFIGDDARDIIAGREANIKTIKLGARMPKNLKLEPHFYARDLSEAVEIIMAAGKGKVL